MMADIRMLQEQSQQLQNLLGTLTEALKAVNTRLDQQADVNRKAFADQKLVIDNLTNDLRVIREKVDDNNVRVGSLVAGSRGAAAVGAAGAGAAVARRRRRSERRPALPPPARRRRHRAGAGAAPAAVGTSPHEGCATRRTATTRPASTISPIDGFEAYIRDFPKSDQADDAQVYIGNSYCRTARTTRRSKPTTGDPHLPDEQRDSRRVLQEGARAPEPEAVDGAREAWEYVVKTIPTATRPAWRSSVDSTPDSRLD